MLVTGLYAAFAVFMLVLLALNVIRLRLRHGVSLGDGGYPEIKTAGRMHGNFIENTPIALIIILLFETVCIPPLWMVHALCSMLLVTRASHALAIAIKPNGTSFLRVFGMIGTFIAMLIPAATIILHYFGYIRL